MRQIKHEGPRENGIRKARCWEEWETAQVVFAEGVRHGDAETGKTVLRAQVSAPSRYPRSQGLLKPETLGRGEPGAVRDGVFCQQLPPASLPNLEVELGLHMALEGEAWK